MYARADSWVPDQDPPAKPGERRSTRTCIERRTGAVPSDPVLVRDRAAAPTAASDRIGSARRERLGSGRTAASCSGARDAEGAAGLPLRSGTGVEDVASTAVWMSPTTASGWERAIECEASTSIVSAPGRRAICRSASGWIAFVGGGDDRPGGGSVFQGCGLRPLVEDRSERALHDGEDLGGLSRQVGREGGAVELRGDGSGELEMLSAPGQGSRVRGPPREAAPLDLDLRPDGRLGLVARRGVHGRANGAVEAGAVDTLGDAVGDRVLGAREVQRDAVVLEWPAMSSSACRPAESMCVIASASRTSAVVTVGRRVVLPALGL